MSQENPDPGISPTVATESSTVLVPPAPPAPSPGAMIREAREQLRWSLDDLAGQTKLARHALEALERDDYGALLEPVYVRGYYRKCAKVLGLDEQTMISAYEARVAPKTQLPPTKLRLASGTELGSTSRLPVSLAIGAAVLGVVATAFIWLARAPVAEPNATTTTTIEAPATSIGEPLTAEAPAADGATAEQDSQAPGAASVPVDEASPAAATVDAAATPSAAAGSGVAQLQFAGESWVRVDDASGKTLLNGLMSAGAVRSVTGAVPLSVFLGKASEVTVQFDGQSIDTTPFRRDNATARFTLPLAAN